MVNSNIQVLFRRVPEGLPVTGDFEIVESEFPKLKNHQFLIQNEYLSLDPYMRMLMGGGWQFRGYAMEPGQVMIGRCLGKVTESRHADFAIGDLVIGGFGWQTNTVSDGTNVEFRVSSDGRIPPTAYLGACGSNGLTAWVGLRMIGDPQPGETVVVSAAAGSVGSAAGQIAKAWGCTVIGIAGGTEKCRIVTEEYGFDACCDYKSADLDLQLREASEKGIDVYFDNVGGEMLDTILPLLNRGARVPVCGVLSQYNASGDYYGVRNTRLIFDKQLRLQGFLVSGYRDKWDAAREKLVNLVANGQLKYRESIADGIENAPEAFIGMLKGENFGKQLVRLIVSDINAVA